MQVIHRELSFDRQRVSHISREPHQMVRSTGNRHSNYVRHHRVCERLGSVVLCLSTPDLEQ